MQERDKRILWGWMIVLSTILSVAVLFGMQVHANSNYTIEGKCYEPEDMDNFVISGQEYKHSRCCGAPSIGTLTISHAIGEKVDYNRWQNIGVEGDAILSYTYNGAYRKTDKEQWNLSSGEAKTVNGIMLENKVWKGTFIVERSMDGINWETVYTKNHVFRNVTSDIASFYRISEEDVRRGSYFRVTLAYRMERRIGTELFFGIIPMGKYEYKDFVEKWEFIVCCHQNPICLRD